jgi:hypothetical protein
LQEDPFFIAPHENSNYKSVEAFVDKVEEQFREEAALGWMEELSDQAFVDTWYTAGHQRVSGA